jgi:hypothetical protein
VVVVDEALTPVASVLKTVLKSVLDVNEVTKFLNVPDQLAESARSFQATYPMGLSEYWVSV